MAASAIQFEVDSRAIAAVTALGDGSLLGEVRAGMGHAVHDVLVRHFEELQSERSGQTGGKPTNFWFQVSQSVHDPVVSGEDVTINIAHVGLAQRYFGGTIHAGQGVSSVTGEPTKFLAIPVDVDSYGKRPSDFPEGVLQYIVGPSGPCLILAEHTDRIATKGKNKGKSVAAKAGQEATHGAGSVMFVLRESVNQKADPSVLPTDAEITAAALVAGSEQAQRILDRLADGVTPGNS